MEVCGGRLPSYHALYSQNAEVLLTLYICCADGGLWWPPSLTSCTVQPACCNTGMLFLLRDTIDRIIPKLQLLPTTYSLHYLVLDIINIEYCRMLCKQGDKKKEKHRGKGFYIFPPLSKALPISTLPPSTPSQKKKVLYVCRA
jgi:hypothetical protein